MNKISAILEKAAREIEKVIAQERANAYAEAVQAIMGAAAAAEKTGMNVPVKQPLKAEKQSGIQGESTAAKVVDFIRFNPGLTGVEVIKALQTADPTINERTVRTAFNRLKGKKIKKNRKKWYPI
ncbi:MAG: hypothetical protein ACAH83_08705 [Alphaproteobacteria bacterium]